MCVVHFYGLVMLPASNPCSKLNISITHILLRRRKMPALHPWISNVYLSSRIFTELPIVNCHLFMWYACLLPLISDACLPDPDISCLSLIPDIICLLTTHKSNVCLSPQISYSLPHGYNMPACHSDTAGIPVPT